MGYHHHIMKGLSILQVQYLYLFQTIFLIYTKINQRNSAIRNLIYFYTTEPSISVPDLDIAGFIFNFSFLQTLFAIKQEQSETFVYLTTTYLVFLVPVWNTYFILNFCVALDIQTSSSKYCLIVNPRCSVKALKVSPL